MRKMPEKFREYGVREDHFLLHYAIEGASESSLNEGFPLRMGDTKLSLSTIHRRRCLVSGSMWMP